VANDRPWWRSAVVYQIYIRSFTDGSGDGIGDIEGVRARLPYLKRLGVDAIWINPWYPSPMADGGYDVADYRDIHPVLGTLAQADRLIAETHAHGIRILLDIVPNHTASTHPWFIAALAAGPGSAERRRYLFRDGRGADGSLPPNNWLSAFGGPAWTRAEDGQWYLHMFAPGQPDLNWAEPEVVAEFESVLRFWFDRGVDGFRIDVANRMVKDPLLPDVPGSGGPAAPAPGSHPYQDRDGVHEIYRGWRRVADSYPEPRVFVAEAWMDDQHRLALYLRPDELQQAFSFDFLVASWQAAAVRASIESTIATVSGVGAPATWVLSNHDVVRHLSRFGRPPRAQGRGVGFVQLNALARFPLDRDLGTRRARAGVLLLLGLPGSAYLYQGEELGLWEVEDLPDEVLQDPTWEQSGHRDRGRDGCRVPLPWSGDGPPFGFGPGGSSPWLPQPPEWKALTAAAQDGDPGSMLGLYREAIRLRHAHDAFGDGPLRWLDAPDGVLAFARDPAPRSGAAVSGAAVSGAAVIGCAVNFSGAEPWSLPEGSAILLASGPLAGGALPRDTGVWFSLAGS
jgi:alpha-glucosidase